MKYLYIYIKFQINFYIILFYINIKEKICFSHSFQSSKMNFLFPRTEAQEGHK
jgi:hypothetical protein